MVRIGGRTDAKQQLELRLACLDAEAAAVVVLEPEFVEVGLRNADAVKRCEVLGLRIDYYTILDLEGFSGLVDAMGGVVMNVPREIPIGGGHNLKTGAPLPIHGYVHKGRHRLNGREALWFAR